MTPNELWGYFNKLHHLQKGQILAMEMRCTCHFCHYDAVLRGQLGLQRDICLQLCLKQNPLCIPREYEAATESRMEIRGEGKDVEERET